MLENKHHLCLQALSPWSAIGLLLAFAAAPLTAQNGDRPGHVMTEIWRQMEVPPAPVLSPEQGLASLYLPEGFRAELVAAEPLVEDPVAIKWDERGRLWVVEMRGFMPNVDGIGEDQPVGQVVVLDDTDRDGVMDKGTVFLDGLVMPRALALVSEGVLIAEPPHLWLCRDRDGNDRCDEKIEVAQYGDPSLDKVEHTENGLLWALDNWIYSAKSDRRLRVRGDRVEVRPTAFRGQWGLSQDNSGRLYYNTNSRWLFADLHPAEYHYRNTFDRPLRIAGVGDRIVSSEEVHTVRVNPGINRGYQPDMLRKDGRLARTTSVSGLCIYRGHQFGAEYLDDVFIPEPAGNVVGFFELDRNAGAIAANHVTYPDEQWQTREFLASPDERFRPVDCAVGPDGALTVIDMYRGILQHRQYVTTFLRKQILERQLDRPLGLGRIYRIVAEGRPIDHARPALADLDQQIAALRHPNGWHRDTAQRLLVEAHAPQSVAPLRALARSEGDRLARVHALWTLHGMHQNGTPALDTATVQQALASSDPLVRRTGLRLIDALDGGARSLVSPTVKRLALAQPSETARIAVFALGDLETQDARQLLIELAAESDERVRTAAVSGLAGAELAALEKLLTSCLAETPCFDSAETLFRSLFRRAGSEGLNDVERSVSLLEEAVAMPQRRAAALRLVQSLTTLSQEADWRPLRFPTNPTLVDQLAARPSTTDLAAELGVLFGHGEASSTKPEYDRVAARRLFRSCESCHDDGRAASGLAPSLAGAHLATGAPETLIKLILDGVSGPLRSQSDGELWNEVMPGFRSDRRFTNEALAALVSHIRSSWGNDLPAVDAETVGRVRDATAERSEPWTVDELGEQN